METNSEKEFRVKIVLPGDMTVFEMRNYIEEAITTWCGSKNPEEDPVFDLDRESVHVSVVSTEEHGS
jgi:hypothetical protein